MIKIDNIEVYGWEATIRGMRNPMNSHHKSDSYWKHNPFDDKIGVNEDEIVIGDNDLKLMQSLIRAGTDHSKFMRMINVTMDITAPFYYWKEFSTYKIGTVANSCSTMHKIHSKEFTLDDFSHEHLFLEPFDVLKTVIDTLNIYRNAYNNGVEEVTNEGERIQIEKYDKQIWWQMIQLLPSSYNQKRTVQLNYQVLRNIYFARRNHKLDEWNDFCHMIEELPYAKKLICLEDEK